jgi:murein DD-endopeptidase MepM/ murein hydrolase activator NlpD
LVAGAGGWLWWRQSAPGIQGTFTPPLTHLGLKTPLTFVIASAKGGVQSIEIRLAQGDRVTTIVKEDFPAPVMPPRPFTWTIDAKGLGLQEGSGRLEVIARDSYWRPFGRNTRQILSQPVSVDLTPPSLEILSVTQYVHQGGGGLLVYRAKGAKRSGLALGDRFFPGASGLGREASVFVALFAIPYDAPTTTPLLLAAEDEAGNSATRTVSAQILTKKFPSDTVKITEAFLRQKLPELLPGEPLNGSDQLVHGFLIVNREKRKEADERIRAVTRETQGKPLWEGAFAPQKNAKVFSNFAEQRTYVFDGKPIDSQVHFGYDLASTRESPIPAPNRGKVVLAEPLTIYGNTVILDHGLGLATLYGHMSRIDVKVGQVVEKGELLGRSGATGLAIGDHLHFTVLIHGVPVTPLEWWDSKWIRDHITRPLESAGIQLR